MDANALLDQLIQDVSSVMDSFSARVQSLRVAVQKSIYHTLDAMENDARSGRPEGQEPALEEEVWDGLINLVNINAPQQDIESQENAYRSLVYPESGE